MQSVSQFYWQCANHEDTVLIQLLISVAVNLKEFHKRVAVEPNKPNPNLPNVINTLILNFQSNPVKMLNKIKSLNVMLIMLGAVLEQSKKPARPEMIRLTRVLNHAWTLNDLQQYVVG